MKLLNYSTGYFAFILFFLLSLWAVIFYYEMLDEIYDSLDDGLENQKLMVMQKALEDPSILEQEDFENGTFRIKRTSYESIANFTDSHRDTLMYMKTEADYEPVRLLESVFKQDGEYYRLQVITSMVEEDDLVKELFFALLWLYLGLILSILLLNSLLQKRIWKPFYSLLRKLGNFRIEKDRKLDLEPSNIEEFRLLNSKVDQLIRKAVESFDSQKEFIENASHELQTPLAISINKLELLVEKNQLSEEQMEEIGAVLEHLERLTRFNRSLLLLSKIENRQFPEEESVDLNAMLQRICEDLKDMADHKEIALELAEDAQLSYRMNADLANILFTNLIKNALTHGSRGTTVKIEVNRARVKLANAADQGPLDHEKIFSRFQPTHGEHRSTGLGLAISKSIAEKYGIDLSYSYEQTHIFELKFPK